MALRFCRRCKTLLSPQKREGVLILECDKCGFVEKDVRLDAGEKIKHSEEVGEGVVDEKNIFATYKSVCDKCGYGKAEVIDQGIKYSDEAGDLLLKCGKCGWAEHLNKKTS